MATLKDVAALAGVSTATVSLALNGGPVNAKTRQLVLKAAKQLHYVPNRIGQMLTTGRSNMIELIILTGSDYPDIVRKTSLFYYLMEGVLAVADKEGFGVRFAVKSHDDPSLTQYFAEIIGSRTVDGIAVIPQFAREYRFTNLLQEANYPYVLLRPSRFGADANHVDMGNYEGGKMVGELLVDSGARRIGIINGPSTHVDAIERERGFSEALLDRGGMIVAKQYGEFTIESGHAAMQKMAERGLPEAVFCGNDYMAAGALRFLRSIGVSCPRQIAIVGYDNNDVAIATDPQLTTVDNRFFDLGHIMADEVIGLIRGSPNPVARRVPPEMKLRESHLFGSDRPSG